MPKFKVGDIVVGNREASIRYSITREGWVGEVTKVYGDRINLRNVETKAVYANLHDSSFDLVEQIDEEEFRKLL